MDIHSELSEAIKLKNNIILNIKLPVNSYFPASLYWHEKMLFYEF